MCVHIYIHTHIEIIVIYPVDFKSSHTHSPHKLLQCEVMVIILEYVHQSNSYAVHLKLTQC